MAAMTEPAATLVLSDGSVNPEAGFASRLSRAASPVIIGLVAPILLMMIIDPSMLKHARFLIVAVLIPMLIISIGIYTYSVLNPGEVCGLVVHQAARKLEIVEANIFASRKTEVAFSEIANARVVAGYDRDGYPTSVAELVLRTGQRVPLPAGTADVQVKALRLAIGLK
ncbi:MAG: hypothetical protein ACKVP7_14745 [Hyphomicrobiaceae bacterium]